MSQPKIDTDDFDYGAQKPIQNVDDKSVKFYGAHLKIMLIYANLFIVIIHLFIYLFSQETNKFLKFVTSGC